ncbi:hypothetical protein IscW_ISCW012093 [Ixodes scapularis]|uniref:Uncharacterized protein n=1 Tax=Ixodes scapularis TaxID=6945 RepID=B7QG79_IXOSC|nr:hypothetical protein IscW_ISCW012093 [Ixodes scapularis]|eukprot:XP_002401263.1 hypothetical protein IscW_ISCW012093 [Ixodes scapularis]
MRRRSVVNKVLFFSAVFDMASFVKWICLAASVSVTTGFDFGSLDPKAMIDKIRDTLEMAVGMLWITGLR